MDDLEQQIKAWADASAPSTGEAIDPADVLAGRAPAAVVAAPHRRGRWLAAAAAVLVIAAVGVGLAVQSDPPERIRAEQAPTTGTPTPPSAGFVGDIAFDELATVSNGADAVGLLEAQTDEQLAGLWSAAGHPRAAPEVDFDRQVVVAITIADDACPPDLVAFRRDGATVAPEFAETQAECEQPLVLTTYVAALDWSDTGDEFLLVVDGQRPENDRETLAVTREVHQTAGTIPATTTATVLQTTTTTPASDPPPVLANLELEATTVASGATLKGSVVIVNDTGKPITASTCGPAFALRLGNDEYAQEVIGLGCAGSSTIPVGRSTHPVEVVAAYTTCTQPGFEGTGPPCQADGTPPGLPAGRWVLSVVDDQRLVPAITPVPITIT
jgi:hypothetical protein